VCYLERAGGGVIITGIRMVGDGDDHQWRPEQDEPDALESARSGARWVADRLSEESGPLRLDALCVDVAGAVCAWVTAPSDDPVLVGAALRQRGGGFGDATDHQDDSIEPWHSPGLIDDTSIQALGNGRPSDQDHAGRRLAAMVVPDAAPRVFLDALDDAGIQTTRVLSLWQAMALVWDPGADDSQSPGADRVVATDAPLTGVVIFDPRGRMVWSWSGAGRLLAGGSMRVRIAGDPEANGRARPIVTEHDLGRLVAEWLSWSAQLGVAPVRIVALGPIADAGEDSLAAADVGATLGGRWPGASVDLIVDEDPIGATLARLSGTGRSMLARQQMADLTRRPGRIHRAMYRWSALAITIGAILLSVAASREFGAAGRARAEQRRLRSDLIQRIREASTEAALSPFPEIELQKQIDALKPRETTPDGFARAKPMLEELESLSFVLDREDVMVVNLIMHPATVTLDLVVPDTRTGEEFYDSLQGIAGHVHWSGMNYQGDAPRGFGENMRKFQYVGDWVDSAPEGS